VGLAHPARHVPHRMAEIDRAQSRAGHPVRRHHPDRAGFAGALLEAHHPAVHAIPGRVRQIARSALAETENGRDGRLIPAPITNSLLDLPAARRDTAAMRFMVGMIRALTVLLVLAAPLPARAADYVDQAALD